MNAKQKWIALALDIIAWELTCDEENLLSAECDRQIAKHPYLARLFIVGLGAILITHLANLHERPELTDVVSTSFWARFSH